MFEDITGDGNTLDIYSTKASANHNEKPVVALVLNDDEIWLSLDDAKSLSDSLLWHIKEVGVVEFGRDY